MRLKIVMVLSAALAAIVCWRIVVASGSKSQRARNIVSESVSETTPVARLEPQIVPSHQEPRQPEAFQATVAPAPEPQPIEPSPAKPPVEAPSEDERRTYAAVAFEGESFDRSWAVEARRTIQAKLDAIKDSDVRVGPIDCRSTLCRFELHSEAAASLQGYMRQMIRSGVGAGMAVRGNASAPNPGTMTIYLARAGAPLPEMPVE
ncbi:MAG TPA: hypothetical protein VER11_17930 [Polyangiaceae bacterium]|nr:hypothetical protein [Polyangiaceae bacterium]